jgi:hypothetical protein
MAELVTGVNLRIIKETQVKHEELDCWVGIILNCNLTGQYQISHNIMVYKL